jgi:hypothetical protein
MERSSMLMDWKNQHCENGYTTKIYMFNALSIKIPMTFFTQIEESILKLLWKYKRPPITKAIMIKKNPVLEVTQFPTSNYTKEP